MKNTFMRFQNMGLSYLAATILLASSCAPIHRIEEEASLTLSKMEWRMHLVSNDIKRGVESNMKNIEKKVDLRMDNIEKKVDLRMDNIEKRIESLIIPPITEYPILKTNLNQNFEDKYSFNQYTPESKKEKKVKKEISFNKYTPKIEFRNGVKRDKKVDLYLSQIEKVPDSIQEIIDEEGGRIIFFNGPLTHNSEMSLMKGVKPSNWKKYTYDDLSACYDPVSRSSFIGVKGNYVGEDDHTLHEYGHNYDYQIGWYFFGKPLSETKRVLEAVKKEPFVDRYYNNPREYIANSFDNFYNSKKTKKNLEKNNPTIHKILSEIEMKSLE
jgi:hypothetical protein